MARKKLNVEVDYKVNGAKKVDDAFEGIAKSANDAAKETQNLNQNTTAFGSQLPGVAGKAQGLFNSLKTGLANAKVGFGTLKGAIASTGIGILLIAFGSLMSYFTKTERGAEKLRTITAVLGGVMDGVMDIVIGLGESLFEAFSNPMESLQKLGNFIKENIINRFTAAGKAFAALKQLLSGDISGGLKGLGDAAIQAATGVEGAIDKVSDLATQSAESAKKIMAIAEAAGELQNAMNELENSERDFAVTSAKNISERERLIALSKDQTRSDKERVEALKAAGELEKQTVAQQIEFAQERLRIISEQNALAESGEKDIQAERDAEVALINLQTESFKKLGAIKAQESALEKRITADREAEIKKRKDAEQKAIDEKLKAEQKAAEEQKRIEEEKTEAKRLEDEKRVRIEQGRIDLELSLQEDGVDKEIALIKRAAEKRRAQLESEGILTQELLVKLEEDTNNKILEAQKKADDTSQKQIDDDKQKELDKRTEVADASIALADQLSSTISNIKLGGINAQQSALDKSLNDGLISEEEYNKKSEELAKEANRVQRNATLIKLATDTASAISSLVNSSTANPLNSTTFGTAGAIQFASGMISIAANMATAAALLKQPAPAIGGGGGGGGGGASGPAPSTNETRPVDNTFNGTSAGSQTFQPTLIKAYVSETDISQSQASANQIQQLSQIG